ncbi:MAG: sigma-70 family RNA polymerase sigma factor [Planctomycetota bacterium]|nr:sigma-70 family RNA polymerase sigma factor [Planctomycetota bacterium]
MEVAHADDVELAHRIAAGDEAAAEEVVRSLGREMFGFARRMLSDSGAAEDAMQETLLAILKGASKFDGRVPLRAWGFGILRHKITDTLRKRGREAVIGDVDPERDAFNAKGAWKHMNFAPWREDEETLQVVRDCMETLPLRQREALELFAVEGKDGVEAAALLGVTPVNLRQILHRGRSAVRKCADAKLGSDED